MQKDQCSNNPNICIVRPSPMYLVQCSLWLLRSCTGYTMTKTKQRKRSQNEGLPPAKTRSAFSTICSKSPLDTRLLEGEAAAWKEPFKVSTGSDDTKKAEHGLARCWFNRLFTSKRGARSAARPIVSNPWSHESILGNPKWRAALVYWALTGPS